MEAKRLERYLKTLSCSYSFFGVGTIVTKDKHHFKTTLILHLLFVSVLFFGFLNDFPVYIEKTNGVFCKLVTFIFHWSDLMKVMCTCFRGIFQPNGINYLINSIVALEKNIHQINKNKKKRSVWFYPGLFFMNFGMPFLISALHASQLTEKAQIKIGDIFEIVNRFGLALIHSSFVTFALVIYLQLRDTNLQYKKFRSRQLSLAQRVGFVKMAVWRHSLLTKVWSQLMDIYESYLMFEMLSVTAGTLGCLYVMYTFFSAGQSADALPFKEILLIAQVIYEVPIICRLCNKIINESYKRGIMSEEATLKSTPLFLLDSPSGLKDVKLQRLSCKLYGYFSLNNSLLIMISLSVICSVNALLFLHL